MFTGNGGDVIPFPGYPPLPYRLTSTPGYPSGFIPGAAVKGGNCLVPDPQSKGSYVVIPDGDQVVLSNCAKCRCSVVSSFGSPGLVVDR